MTGPTDDDGNAAGVTFRSTGFATGGFRTGLQNVLVSAAERRLRMTPFIVGGDARENQSRRYDLGAYDGMGTCVSPVIDSRSPSRGQC